MKGRFAAAAPACGVYEDGGYPGHSNHEAKIISTGSFWGKYTLDGFISLTSGSEQTRMRVRLLTTRLTPVLKRVNSTLIV